MPPGESIAPGASAVARTRPAFRHLSDARYTGAVTGPGVR